MDIGKTFKRDCSWSTHSVLTLKTVSKLFKNKVSWTHSMFESPTVWFLDNFFSEIFQKILQKLIIQYHHKLKTIWDFSLNLFFFPRSKEPETPQLEYAEYFPKSF